MATPHIAAEKGDFAPAVLMPGDPKRAQLIAQQLMPDAKLVTDVRGMLGFTGTYKGKPLSVMGSGMGQPSISIYASELYQFYGVERIIRVGTAGGLRKDLKLGDIIVAMSAHTDSHINQARFPQINYSPTASWNLLYAAMQEVQNLSETDRKRVFAGPVYSSDHFYFHIDGLHEQLAQYGTLGVEMETAALFGAAAQYGKEALTVLTISDLLFDLSQQMSSHDRQTKFALALQLATCAALS